MIYEKIGSDDLSLLDFDKAIQLEPELIHAHFNRGLLYLKKGDYYKAVDDFTRETQLNPNSRAAQHFKDAVTYYLYNDYDSCWAEIDLLESMRYNISPAFLKDLKKASGRDK